MGKSGANCIWWFGKSNQLLTIILSITFSLVVSITRGYLAAVECIFLSLVLNQILSQLGYGEYLPRAIPMYYGGAAEALTGKIAAPLGLASYIIVALTIVLSLVITEIWWHYADWT